MTELGERSLPARIVLLALVGAIGGLLSGAFGVGGGIVMVPLLMWMLGFDQRHAAATSLLAIVPTALVASISYLVRGELHVLAGLLVAVGGIVGSLVGTTLLKRLPLGWLRWLFIVLLVVVAIRLAFAVPVRGVELDPSPLVIVGLIALGMVMGIAAGLFGVGGGIIVVPVLIGLFGMSDLLAKGTSLLAMIPSSATGSVANLRNGFVRWRDGIVVGVFAVGASFGGVALAFWLDPRTASIAFAVLVLVAAVQLMVRAIRQGRADRSDP